MAFSCVLSLVKEAAVAASAIKDAESWIRFTRLGWGSMLDLTLPVLRFTGWRDSPGGNEWPGIPFEGGGPFEAAGAEGVWSAMSHSEPIEAIFQRLRDVARREEGYRLLFDRFYWPLFRFFDRRGFFIHECEDLIQETFLSVYRGLEDFRGEAEGERWIFRIAANAAFDALRRRKAAKRDGHEIPLESNDSEDAPPMTASGSQCGGETPPPLRQLLDQERRVLLRQAVDGLPAQMRRCVRMRVFQDLDYDEIAEILQISPSTVKVQLFKASKRLQRELGNSFEGFGLRGSNRGREAPRPE